MKRIVLAATVATFISVYVIWGVIFFAHRKVGYSHRRDTISELGEVGATIQTNTAVVLFLPVGALSLVVAFLVHPASPAAAALASCIAVGYLVAAAFPCDPGSPIFGSGRQAVHNLGGAIQYIGGGIALMVVGETLGRSFELGGFVVAATGLALASLPKSSARGLVQRIGESCLFAGLVLATWRLGGS